MIPLIITFIIIILILAISYRAYRMAFFNPVEGRDNYYDLPPREQYEPLWPRMTKMIDSMVETKFEEVCITSYDGKQLFGHFNIFESSPVKAVKHAKVPIILIHGDDDRFVPCDMSREIHSVRPDLIDFHTFPNAGHGICYLEDTERYEKLVKEFINNL